MLRVPENEHLVRDLTYVWNTRTKLIDQGTEDTKIAWTIIQLLKGMNSKILRKFMETKFSQPSLWLSNHTCHSETGQVKQNVTSFIL